MADGEQPSSQRLNISSVPRLGSSLPPPPIITIKSWQASLPQVVIRNCQTHPWRRLSKEEAVGANGSRLMQVQGKAQARWEVSISLKTCCCLLETDVPDADASLHREDAGIKPGGKRHATDSRTLALRCALAAMVRGMNRLAELPMPTKSG